MRTATNLEYTAHVFQEINKGKYVSTKHYELIESINGESLLSNKLNISKDRGCAKSAPSYWLKIRESNKWSSNITGLFKTKYRLIYWGDRFNKKDLLIFRFSEEGEHLTVYYFKNYFPKNLKEVIKVIGE